MVIKKNVLQIKVFINNEYLNEVANIDCLFSKDLKITIPPIYNEIINAIVRPMTALPYTPFKRINIIPSLDITEGKIINKAMIIKPIGKPIV